MLPTTKPVTPSNIPSARSSSLPTTLTELPIIEPSMPETHPSNHPSLPPSYLPTDPINIDDIISQVTGYEKAEEREINMFEGLAILGGFIAIIAVIMLLVRKTFCHQQEILIPTPKNQYSWRSSDEYDESSSRSSFDPETSNSNPDSYNVQDYIDLVEGQDFGASAAESFSTSSEARAPMSTIHIMDQSAKDPSYRGSKASGGTFRKSQKSKSTKSSERERSLGKKRSSSIRKSRSGSGRSVGSRSHSSHRSKSSHRSSSSRRSESNHKPRRHWANEAHPSSLSHEISTDLYSVDSRATERLTIETSTCCGL